MPKNLLLLLLVPVVFTACSTNNVTVDNSLQNYFDSAGVKGTFGLYDNGQGHFTIYNLTRFRDSAYPPGATFDILQGLVGLQTGAVASDTSKLWDSITLKKIFSGSVDGMGSIRLANIIRLDTLKKWVDSLHYGNRDIVAISDSGNVDGRLKITADEQLGFTKKLYFDQLPFFARTQKIVRSMFLTEQNSNYRLTYKTGNYTDSAGKTVAWILGWEEENKHPYFFVLNFEPNDPNTNVSAVGLQLVKKILAPMGFFAGKK